MLLHKSKTIGLLLLTQSLLAPTAYADQTADAAASAAVASAASSANITLTQLLAGLLGYFNNTSIDPTAMNMAPPGGSDTAAGVGAAAGLVEAGLSDALLAKELSDINWALYTVPPPGEQVTGSAWSNFITNHAQQFCAPSSGIETALPGCNPNNSVAMQYGDIKTSSLLEPTIYSSGTKIIAEEVIQNLTTPFPDTSIAALVSAGLTKNSDKTKVAKAMAQHAALTAARNSLNEIYGARLPASPPSGGAGGAASNQPASIISIMDSEAGRRFKNPTWYTSVQSSSHEALLRELVEMEAYKMWTDYYRYRQNERMETLLAVMVAQLANQALQLQAAMPAQ